MQNAGQCHAQKEDVLLFFGPITGLASPETTTLTVIFVHWMNDFDLSSRINLFGWLSKNGFQTSVVPVQSNIRTSITPNMPQTSQLTHFDDQGNARMVSVSDKFPTHRTAVVSGQVIMHRSTAELITDKKFSKGDVIEVARLAGIMASKRTSELIPLCHPIAIDSVDLNLAFEKSVFDKTSPSDTTVTLLVSATVAAEQKTGVEMEAFTAVSIACLTVYDMCKSVDRSMRVSNIQLEHKSGGKSGDFSRQALQDKHLGEPSK